MDGSLSRGPDGRSLSDAGNGKVNEPGMCVFFFQAEDGIRDLTVTGVQTCALPIYTHAKMNPPLREAADVAALRAALKQGVIDCIASDHAPHAYDAKEAAFDDAPFGIVGLETAFALATRSLSWAGCSRSPS